MVRPSEMNEILRQVGWTEGFNIPALNDENRLLESEVAALMREKASLMTSLAELDDLLGSLKSHTGELETESAQNEAMLATQQKRLESEDALIRVLQGEQSRLKNAIALEKQQRWAVEERCQRMEQQLSAPARPRGDAEAVQEQLQRQETLASLTTDTLAQFYKEDQAKLKDLELQRLRLQEQVLAAYKQLQEANGNVLALEQQLDTCANQYHSALSAKAELTDRWRTTANTVRNREEGCRVLNQDVSELNLILETKMAEMREAKELEEEEQRKGREVEAHSRMLEHDISRLRENLKEYKSVSASLSEEVSSLQCHLAGCGSDLSEQRKVAQDLVRQIKEREEQRESLKEGCIQRKARLADLGDLTGDSEKRNQKLESMVQEKNRAVAGAREGLQRLDNETIKSRQEAAKVKLAIDNCLVAVNAEEVALRQCGAQKSTLDKLLERHRDMLLSVDLEIHRAELRLQKIANDKAIDMENAAKLVDKEILLKEALAEKQANFAELERELKILQSSERQVLATLGASQNQLSGLQAAEKAYWAEVEGGDGRVVSARTDLDQDQVRQSLLSAKVSRRKEELAAVKADVLGLKNTALQADRVGRLQSTETESEVAALSAQVASAQNEVSDLKQAISRRKIRLQQLQGVFEMTLKSMEGSGVEELDSIERITKQQIRVAQEKGELVQKGNQLDLHIRTAEHEIQAMEHTLALVKSANDRYRSSLALPGAQASESVDEDLMVKIQSEEEKQHELRAELKKKKEHEAKVYEQCQNMREELAETEETYQQLIAEHSEKKQEVSEIERDIAELDIKLRRAVNQAKRLRRELRAGNSGPTYEERDLEVKEMRRVTTTALKQLFELGPEARPLVTQYLQEKGLPSDQPSLLQAKIPSTKSPSLLSV